MSLPEKMTQEEFDQLLERFFDETISDEEAAELLAAVEADPGRGETFFLEFKNDFLPRFHARTKKKPFRFDLPESSLSRAEVVGTAPLDVEVRAMMELLKSMPIEVSPEENTVAPRHKSVVGTKKSDPDSSRKRFSFNTAVVCLTLLVSGFLPLIYFEWFPRLNEPTTIAVKSDTIATLSSCLDVQWDGNALSPGKPLGHEAIRFQSGTVELLFYNGVHAVIEGPADLILSDRNQVFCRYGRFSVTVPKQGSGFEIQSRQWLVRDIGTQFCVEMNENAARVDVVRGVVEVELPSDAEKKTLTTLQGAAMSRNRPLERFTADGSRFVDRDELLRRWAQWFAGPGQKSTVEKNTLPRFSAHFSPNSVDLHAYGGRWEQENDTKSPSFCFTEQKDRLRVRTSGELKSFTLVLHVRVDRLNSRLNPLVMSEGSSRGGVLWHVNEQGAIVFGLRPRNNRQAGTLVSPVVFTEGMLGRWNTLAVTVDATTRSATLFLNGSPILADNLAEEPVLNLSGIDLGNWVPAKNKRETFRQLDGAIDRFLVYDQPLSYDEIRRLFLSGAAPDRSENEGENHETELP